MNRDALRDVKRLRLALDTDDIDAAYLVLQNLEAALATETHTLDDLQEGYAPNHPEFVRGWHEGYAQGRAER